MLDSRGKNCSQILSATCATVDAAEGTRNRMRGGCTSNSGAKVSLRRSGAAFSFERNIEQPKCFALRKLPLLGCAGRRRRRRMHGTVRFSGFNILKCSSDVLLMFECEVHTVNCRLSAAKRLRGVDVITEFL